MRRVEQNGSWSLFCPNEAPGLFDVYGEEFDRLFEKYESQGLARKTIRAQELWMAILSSQVKSGPCLVNYPYPLSLGVGGDWNTLHLVQRCLQFEVKPKESWDDSLE